MNEIQKKAYSAGPYAVHMPETPDFCKLAEAFGIESRRIDDEAVMDEAISRMLSFDGPFLLECVVDSDESTMLQ